MKHELLLSVPCTECDVPAHASCTLVTLVDDTDNEARLNDLYYYAMSCALSALIGFAALHGRGWYHFADGELIAGSEILLS